MARRGKTTIKGQGSKAREQREASAAGQAAVQRQDEFAGRQSAHALDRAGQQGTQVAGIIQRQEQMEGQQDIAQKRVDLDAAKSGLMENPRMQALQAEMDRGANQAKQPLEYEGQRYIPTPMAKQQAAAEQSLAEERGITERMRAQAYRAQVSGQLLRARASGNKEDMKVLSDTLMKPLNSSVSQLNRLVTGKGIKADDWGRLAKNYKDNPDPQLQEAIAKKQMTPRLRQFLENKIAEEALTYIVMSQGEMPKGDVVDFSSPAMQNFVAAQKRVQMSAMAMGSQFQGIKDYGQKIRLLNQRAALEALKVLANPAAGQLIPSQQASPEQQQALDQQKAQEEAKEQNEQFGAPSSAPSQQPGAAALQQGAGASFRAGGREPGDLPSTWEEAK